MLKDNEYSNNPRTEDDPKKILDVVFQISTGEFRHAVNNVLIPAAVRSPAARLLGF
jgi:hypothetical protein